VLLDMNRAPEAMERLGKALVLDSVSSDGLRLKARAQAELKDVDGARATYMKALVLNDQDTWAMNNLGVLELNAGDVAGSVGPLARAVQLNPTAPIFQNNLGMALERSGHRVAALRAYEAAVKADSTYAKAVKNAQRLGAVVTDTTANDGFSVRDAAEQFRLEVKTWKDGTVPSVPKVRPPMLPSDDTVGVQVDERGW
jgi:Flp pilus assembly protein TadD